MSRSWRAPADSTEAIRLDPKNAMAYYNRGPPGTLTRIVHTPLGIAEVQVQELAYREPVRDVACFLHTNRCNSVGLLLTTAWCSAVYEIGQGEYDRAIADSTEAIRLDPKNAMAYYNRGRAGAQGRTTGRSPT